MGIFDWVIDRSGKGIVDAVKDLVDEFVTTEQERLELLLKKEEQRLRREELYVKDTQSAREMQKEALRQEDKFSKRFIYYFASAWTFIASLYIGAITFCEIPDNNIRFADTILGFILGTIISQIIAFFYGSSMGSKQKEKLMAKIVREDRRFKRGRKHEDEDEDEEDFYF